MRVRNYNPITIMDYAMKIIKLLKEFLCFINTFGCHNPIFIGKYINRKLISYKCKNCGKILAGDKK